MSKIGLQRASIDAVLSSFANCVCLNAAAAAVLAEQLEAALANGQEINVERHALLCSTLTRLAQLIGIDRRAKSITPNLREYLAMKDQEDAVEIEEAAE